jgi:hypothetical protein
MSAASSGKESCQYAFACYSAWSIYSFHVRAWHPLTGITGFEGASASSNDSVMQLQQAPVSRRSPNWGVKNSWQEAHSDGSFSCNSSFKMESTNMLHGFIGVIGAVRPTRRLLATDQTPRENR